MIRNLIAALTILVPVVGAEGGGGLHSGDIYVGVEDGVVVTGRILEGGEIDLSTDVFAGVFGDSGCDAFTANPGFDSFAGTFPAGSQLGWNALAGLKRWSGAGFDPAEEAWIEVSFGSQSFDIADGPAEGFGLFVQSNGGFHRHVDFCLNGCPNGCSIPPEFETGVYLIELEMFSTDKVLETSDPFWIVFDVSGASGELEAAFDWAEENLPGMPCPSDLTDDGLVDVSDLLALLAAWGPCDGCAADLDGDGTVAVTDLLDLLASWGVCP